MEIKEFKEKLASACPEEWNQIPDIDLYMDQVISYMKRQHIGFDIEGDENLTSAMINNYIKSGLLPRAKGKKYNREHIGYLTAICLLKQVLSVSESGVLLGKEMEHMDIEEFYDEYRETVAREFRGAAEKLPEDADDRALTVMALRMAVSSYANMICCKEIIKALDKRNEDEEK